VVFEPLHKIINFKVRILSEVVRVPVVVVTKMDDHVEAINTAIRDAGHAAHCILVEKLA
jgi:hypothetical protein